MPRSLQKAAGRLTKGKKGASREATESKGKSASDLLRKAAARKAARKTR